MSNTPSEAKTNQARNVLGGELEICCTSPMTGFYRNGRCDIGPEDRGMHGVCAQVTETFLGYTQAQGNDLTTPNPLFGFPGLKPGDRWCLCASRWQEALEDGVAPPVVLSATHEAVLEILKLEDLKAYGIKAESGS